MRFNKQFVKRNDGVDMMFRSQLVHFVGTNGLFREEIVIAAQGFLPVKYGIEKSLFV